MAKGVKKIKWVPRENDAKVFPKLSIANKLLVIEPNKWAWFEVSEWEAGTIQQDKRKDITWIRQDKSNYIIGQKTLPSDNFYGVRLTKKLCGPYTYYLEASSTGKPDATKNRGLKYRGHCPEKIVKCGWSKTKGNTDLTNKNDNNHGLAYGDIIFLHAETEGLNGSKVIVDVYNKQVGEDALVHTYTNVDVMDGEINVKITNSASWKGKIWYIKENEEFYVKVKTPSGRYITDGNKETEFGKYLNIKNKIVTPKFEVPSNQTPLKIGESGKNHERYEPCKFDAIKIKDTDADKKPVTITVYEGAKTKIEKVGNPKETLHNTIYFDFNKATVEAGSIQLLSNILQFLLEHPFSTMRLNGYACVIGKQNYNNKLSQQRADVVKKFFADGKLDPTRITSIGHGEVNATDDKKGADNIKYKNEEKYNKNRRVDIIFDYYGHVGQAVYETVAPSSGKNITLEVIGYDTKKCFKSKDPHKKGIKVNSIHYTSFKEVKEASSISIPVHSDLSAGNPAPIQYIWPKYNLQKGATGNGIDSAVLYYAHIHSFRWFTDNKSPNLLIKAYPDIKWTLEFKWNHTQPFAYTYGNKLHAHDLKTGKSKVIGSEIDRQWSKKHGEMAQSFELSLQAEWDDKAHKLEVGKDFGEKISKTLGLFNKIKSMTEKVSNSPLTKGKIMFEIKSPVIAFSAQWYLQRGLPTSSDVATMVVIGVVAKPLVEAEFTINLFKIFIETAGNAVCPGAGKVITWVMDKLESNVGIHFLVIFSGGIYVDGKVTINTSYPKETTGEVKATGKIQVTIEFKAWAKAGSANIGVDGVIKADVSISVSGGVKVGADKDGIYSCPIAEFGGIKATFVAAATVKFGIFKRTFSYENEAILVEPDEIKFSKYYLDL